MGEHIGRCGKSSMHSRTPCMGWQDGTEYEGWRRGMGTKSWCQMRQWIGGTRYNYSSTAVSLPYAGKAMTLSDECASFVGVCKSITYIYFHHVNVVAGARHGQLGEVRKRIGTALEELSFEFIPRGSIVRERPHRHVEEEALVEEEENE